MGRLHLRKRRCTVPTYGKNAMASKQVSPSTHSGLLLQLAKQGKFGELDKYISSLLLPQLTSLFLPSTYQLSGDNTWQEAGAKKSREMTPQNRKGKNTPFF
jgi:hypothetical protein